MTTSLADYEHEARMRLLSGLPTITVDANDLLEMLNQIPVGSVAMDDDKVMPCPFCGSEKITVEWEPCEPLDRTDTNRRWFAECTQCSCQGPFCQKEPQVKPAWNKRTPLPDKPDTSNTMKTKIQKAALITMLTATTACLFIPFGWKWFWWNTNIAIQVGQSAEKL